LSFRPQTTIRYEPPVRSDVVIMVVDALGRTVRRMELGTRPAGTHELSLDASDLSSGVYFYRLEADDFVATRRMVVIR